VRAGKPLPERRPEAPRAGLARFWCGRCLVWGTTGGPGRTLVVVAPASGVYTASCYRFSSFPSQWTPKDLTPGTFFIKLYANLRSFDPGQGQLPYPWSDHPHL